MSAIFTVFCTILLSLISARESKDFDYSSVLQADVTCCPQHASSQSGCTSESGSTCVWISDPNDPIAQVAGSQCVGDAYYKCKNAAMPDENAMIAKCCNGCCGCTPAGPPGPEPNNPQGITGPSAPICGPAPAQGTPSPVTPSPVTPAPVTPSPVTPSPVTPAPVTPSPTPAESGPVDVPPGLPGDVSQEIDDAYDASCKANARDCWDEPGLGNEQNANYNPNDISYRGVEYKGGACCYQYNSLKTNTPNCEGGTPGQSHLVFDIDCDENDFSVVGGDSGDYGLDKSTCYNGLKIDQGCENECNFEVCISYNNLAPGVCPTTKSWVMDKAANVFGFASLDGIPSCNVQSIHSNSRQFMEIYNDQLHENGYHSVQMVGSLMVIGALLLICGVLYWKKGLDHDKDYVALKHGNDVDGHGYATFDHI